MFIPVRNPTKGGKQRERVAANWEHVKVKVTLVEYITEDGKEHGVSTTPIPPHRREVQMEMMQMERIPHLSIAFTPDQDLMESDHWRIANSFSKNQYVLL